MQKILIIEDNQDVNAMLAETLVEHGYEVDSAYTGSEGIKAARAGGYDLVLLDIMLPYKSGDEVLGELRQFSDVPVIIISAKDLIQTKIDLLKLGADDYITKPFDLGEVAARIESVLRRLGRIAEKELVYICGNLKLNTSSKKVSVRAQEIGLTAKEYRILELMLENQGKVFTKANLYESVWGESYIGDDNAVKTHMSNLRTKLKAADQEAEYIETVWGLGYRIRKEQ